MGGGPGGYCVWTLVPLARAHRPGSLSCPAGLGSPPHFPVGMSLTSLLTKGALHTGLEIPYSPFLLSFLSPKHPHQIY